MLTEEVKKSIKESVLCWLATADQDGNPNCSPKEVFAYRNDFELVIANIASPESVKNILVRPQVCVSFVHVLKQKGFKLKGIANYITSESDCYDDYYQVISSIVGNTFPVKGLIAIQVQSVSSIVAPSYYLVPGTTEQSQVELARRIYGI